MIPAIYYEHFKIYCYSLWKLVPALVSYLKKKVHLNCQPDWTER